MTDRFAVPEGNATLPVPAPASDVRTQHEPAETRVGAGSVALLLLATFGGGMALIVPMAYSLALRLAELAPGREEVLGYIIGIGSLVSLVASPLTGILSDRTRTRWGRRRPYTVAGTVVGLASIPLMVLAPNVPVLATGWALSTLGWGTAVGSIGNVQADRLPPAQRGKVSALTGLTMHIAPTLGILLVGLVSDAVALVFALPAVIAVLTIGAFVVGFSEADSRRLSFSDPLSVARVIASFGFDPRRERDFAWNWLGRFLFFFGLSLTTSFSTFFYAYRLELAVSQVASILALTSIAGLVSATLGSTVAGWLSDRFARRRPFIMAAVVVFAAGTVVTALAHDLVALIAGAFVTSLGIAAFSAVGQALVLDVLPHRDTQAGRFMAITGFSQKIPSALAPLVAPALLSVAVVGDAKNYTLLYLCSGALAVVGGLVIAMKVRNAR